MKAKIIFCRVLPVILLVAAITILSAAYYLDHKVRSYRPEASAAISRLTGMKASIAGPLKLRWLGGPSISMKSVKLVHNDSTVATADRLLVTTGIRSLLSGDISISSAKLIAPRFILDGSMLPILTNRPATSDKSGTAVDYSIVNGTIQYKDEQNKFWIMEGINLDVGTAEQPGSSSWHQRLVLAGEARIASIHREKLKIGELVIRANASGGKYRVDIRQARMAGGLVTGFAEAWPDQETTRYILRLNVKGLDVTQSLQAMGNDRIISGSVNLEARLESKGHNHEQLKQHVAGHIWLDGENLVLETIDLDKVLDQYHKSQSFNLVDVGAYFFVGPLGPIATKSYDFAGVYRAGKNGRGQIRKMISKWNIQDGIANAQDVAFSTLRHKVALKGSLSIVENRLDKLRIAVIDDRGCPVYVQQLAGSLAAPELKPAGKLKPVTGPVINLLKKPGELVSGKQCDVFYQGELIGTR